MQFGSCFRTVCHWKKWFSSTMMMQAKKKSFWIQSVDSCRGFRIFLCPTLVSCWLIHLHISLLSLKFTIFINLSFWMVAYSVSVVFLFGVVLLFISVTFASWFSIVLSHWVKIYSSSHWATQSCFVHEKNFSKVFKIISGKWFFNRVAMGRVRFMFYPWFIYLFFFGSDQTQIPYYPNFESRNVWCFSPRSS